MNYGEQRFLMYNEELTPEEKAKQTLALEAIREQARYERKKRQSLAKKVKEGVSLFTKFVIVTLLAVILALLVSCDKPEIQEDCLKVTRIYVGTTLDGITPAIIFEFEDGSGFVAVPAGEHYNAPKDSCELEDQMNEDRTLYRW